MLYPLFCGSPYRMLCFMFPFFCSMNSVHFPFTRWVQLLILVFECRMRSPIAQPKQWYFFLTPPSKFPVDICRMLSASRRLFALRRPMCALRWGASVSLFARSAASNSVVGSESHFPLLPEEMDALLTTLEHVAWRIHCSGVPKRRGPR